MQDGMANLISVDSTPRFLATMLNSCGSQAEADSRRRTLCARAAKTRGNRHMATRATLARMSKLVAAELADGRPGDAAQQAMETLGAAPELAGDLVELLIKEGEIGRASCRERV